MFNNPKRWRNAGLWVSIISFIPVVVEAFGIEVLPETLGAIKEALLGLVSILVVLGILSNPTTPGFSDEKPEEGEEENGN